MIHSIAAALLALATIGAAPLATPPAAPAGLAARAHWAVQGADEETQRAIDRGVMMLYAFDTGEARVAFGEALKKNADAALAYWGLAEADTIDINQPQSDAGDRRGAVAVADGRAHLAHASEVERMLVDAIAKRYGAGSKKDRFTRYAAALSAWTAAHRDDANVLTVAAFAIWNTEDTFFDGHDALLPKTKEMLADLDDALQLEPTNLGAHHLRIHLLEELRRSHEAIPNADALGSYVYPLGTSHLPHMAGHIWARVGEYGRMVDDNEHALSNDAGWFALGDGPGQQYMRNYHDHDVDFVIYGLTTVGRDDEAHAVAKGEDPVSQVKTALRLHEDERVAELAKGATTGYTGFAAAIAAGRRGAAETARAARARIAAEDPLGPRVALIDGAIALGMHDVAARVVAYARAYDRTKNELPGDPKNYYPTPIGEGYAAALLAANQAGEAEAIFRAELKRFPNDPHLEWGLAEALRAQGKDDTAARTAYKAHWKGSRDLTLAALG